MPAHVFSLSEKTLMEVHQSYGPTLFSHNRNYLMRAYPSGLRVSSSNLDPSVFWRKGVQMVALNWQKWDEGMMLNEGMFAGEGGWVLKPKGYRSIDEQREPAVISHESQADAIAHKTLDLVLEIYAGQALPLPTGDEGVRGFHPYVKCELHVEKPEERTGAPIEGGGKSKDGEYKRRTKKKQGIEPDFGGQRLEWVGIPYVVEQLSFLRFEIPINFHSDTQSHAVDRHVTPMARTEVMFSHEVTTRCRIGLGYQHERAVAVVTPTVGGRGRRDIIDAIPASMLFCDKGKDADVSHVNRLKIHDDEIGKDDLAAWACIRLDRLQQGFRFIHLLDARGEQTQGLLLVKITKSLR